jgi:hypothetical protein
MSVHLPLMLVAFVSPKEGVGGPGGRFPAPLASFVTAPVWRAFGVEVVVMPLDIGVSSKGLLGTFGVNAFEVAVLEDKTD